MSELRDEKPPGHGRRLRAEVPAPFPSALLEEEPEEDLVERPLDQVLDVGVNIVRSGLRDLNPGSDYEEIQRVFQKAQSAITAAGVPQATGRKDKQGPKASVDLVRFDDVPRLSEEEFFGHVGHLFRTHPDRLPLDLESMEELSVLLALATEQDSQTREIVGRLEPYLQNVPSERDRELWFGALVELGSTSQRPFFDRAMTRCARGMRYARPSFAERLVQALRQAPSLEHFETLWPWAANELLLLEREKGQRAPQGLVQAVAALPPHRLGKCFRRLIHLDALARGYLPPDAFQNHRSELFTLWIELLSYEESASIAVPSVLRGLRLAPPDWSGAFVLSGLWEEHPWAAPVLRQMLAEWPVDYASPTLVELACRAFLFTLDVMDPAQRGEQWTMQAIAWVGEAEFVAAEPILRDIVDERHGWFLPVWPKAARRAARIALQRLQG